MGGCRYIIEIRFEREVGRIVRDTILIDERELEIDIIEGEEYTVIIRSNDITELRGALNNIFRLTSMLGDLLP